MAITIRNNVFETNSSSTHSISIRVGNQWDTIIPDEEGKIYLNGGEFGWQWEKFNDALTKANYCAVDYISDDSKIEMLKEVICEYTGAKEVIMNFTTDWNKSNWSYVDHGGSGCSSDAFNSKEDLKNFLFNKASWLFLGNDNGTPPEKFFDDPDVEYKYILKIISDELNLSRELQYLPNEAELENIFSEMFYDIRFNVNKNCFEDDSNWISGQEYLYFYKYESISETEGIVLFGKEKPIKYKIENL